MADNLVERKSSITFRGDDCHGEYLYIIRIDRNNDHEIQGTVTVDSNRFDNQNIRIDLQNYRGFVKEVESVLKYLEDNNLINKE